MPNYFLNTFWPRSWNNWPSPYPDPPYCDSSIRREPDFEHRYPSISCLCRKGKFAPRLAKEDEILYMTVLWTFPGDDQPGWHVVASLRVIETFISHKAAAVWYRERHLQLPSNCMVVGNGPLPIARSGGGRPLAEWEAEYAERARVHGTFAVCEPTRMDLVRPPQILRQELVGIFGGIPGTQAGKKISKREFDSLCALLPDRIVLKGPGSSSAPTRTTRPRRACPPRRRGC